MNEQSIRFRFGIFVLASLILLAVLIILFGGFPSYFKRTESYTILFTNAQGVAPGTPVRRSGVNIGDVSSVTLVNDTNMVKVVIRVDEKYSLHKGDRPTIVQGLIGGDSAIAILPPDNPGPADLLRVEPGTVLTGVSPADPGELLKKTADLVQPAQEALTEIRKVFSRINKMGPLVEEMLKDFREMGKMARELAPELKRTSEDIRVTARVFTKVGERVDNLLKNNEDKINKSLDRTDELLKRLNEVMSDENQKNLRETLKNVRDSSQQFETITKDTSALIKESRITVKQANDTFKRADVVLTDLQQGIKPLSEQGPGIFKNLNEGTESLNKTLKDLRELMQVVARGDGTVQRLLSDPALYNNLNDSAAMVTKILPRLDRVLSDVEIFSDKLARHPELIGLGGIVRPSSGLKESPSQPYRVYPLP